MNEIRLMRHQRDAVEKLRNGSILCGGVGTGKSFTALFYFYTKECGAVQWSDGRFGPMLEKKPLYIITTARKRDTKEWDDECSRFDFSDISITIDSWNNLHKYENSVDAFFIFDEQRVVGSGSWVKSFLRIAKANRWILLSATPGDTWMDYIPVFIANGFYKNRTQFLRRHAVYNRYSKYPKVDKWLEPGYLEGLRRRITVTMEFVKETVPHWEDIYVDYDRKAYKKVSEERWDIYKNEPIRDISNACYLMRKVVNSHELRARELFWMVLAKHPKVIVFYNYDYELEQIKETFALMLSLETAELSDGDRDICIAEWNGHKHEPIPKSSHWVYLVQYMAGAEGWNCVETDTIIFYSQNYSYKLMTQAAGRIDRLNTPFTDLYYYVMKSHAPIDRAISRALRNKQNFNEKLFIGVG